MPGIQFDYRPDEASEARIAANALRPPREIYLGPRAEALRAKISQDRASAAPTFEDWKRKNAARHKLGAAIWVVSSIPGVIALLIHAPPALALMLEIAAVAGNVWVRRERFRRRREILDWQDPPPKADGFSAGRYALQAPEPSARGPAGSRRLR